MRPFQANYGATNTSYLAVNQTLAASGSLTLNPTNRDYSYIGGELVKLNDGTIARPVSLTSTGDLSAGTFTIFGTDIYGQAISETVTGPNATTITSLTAFLTVTGISSSTGVATNVAAGRAPGGTSIWYIPNRMARDFDAAAAMVVVSNTTSYTFQHTYDNLFTISTFSAVNAINTDSTFFVSTGTGGTLPYNTPVGGMRASWSTATSNTGTSIYYVYQAGIE